MFTLSNVKDDEFFMSAKFWFSIIIYAKVIANNSFSTSNALVLGLKLLEHVREIKTPLSVNTEMKALLSRGTVHKRCTKLSKFDSWNEILFKVSSFWWKLLNSTFLWKC